jgi:hypothetical protein
MDLDVINVNNVLKWSNRTENNIFIALDLQYKQGKTQWRPNWVPPSLMKVLTQSTKGHEKSSIYLANSLLINRFWQFGPPFLFGHRPPLNILVHLFCFRTTKSFDYIFHPFNLIKKSIPNILYIYIYIYVNSFTGSYSLSRLIDPELWCSTLRKNR